MQDNIIQSRQDFLKKLRKKAELCRFCHSELRAEYSMRRNYKEFLIVLLSASLAVLSGLYYRKILEGDLMLSLIFVLPFAIILAQALDHTVFKWTDKVARHGSAVAIWGNWIREADALEKRIQNIDTDDEKMRNMQKRYSDCMDRTEQIPNSKFLLYKKKFRAYKLKSEAIDTMSLEDLERECQGKERWEKTWKF